MIIKKYESGKMQICPKSRKIATEVVPIILDEKKKRGGIIKGKSDGKQHKIFTGFKVKEYVKEDDQLKHNKKRMKTKKYIG